MRANSPRNTVRWGSGDSYWPRGGARHLAHFQQFALRSLAAISLVSENGRVFSVSLWSEPASLVPVCDFVVIRSGAGCTVARPWEDFSRALGGLRIEPDVLPPYAVMDGWPDAAAFAALIRAPEPAWAAGRGLGIANGRLTIFG